LINTGITKKKKPKAIYEKNQERMQKYMTKVANLSPQISVRLLYLIFEILNGNMQLIFR